MEDRGSLFARFANGTSIGESAIFQLRLCKTPRTDYT